MNTTRASGNEWRQLISGLATGLIVVATVLAALLLASQESGGITPTAIAIVSPTPMTSLPSATPPPLPSATATTTPATATPPAAPGPSATPTSLIACPTPTGWTPHVVRSGETLASIAAATGANVYAIIQGNCLINTDLAPGQTLFLPPLPTRSPGPTPTRIPCGPPLHWVIYRVQPGDTLYSLSVRHGTTVYALAQANCLVGYMLRAGQPLYVPPVIVVSPTWTATRIPPSATTAATPSLTPSTTPPPGVTPSRTPTVSPSPTSGPTASASPTSGPTASPSPSSTPQPPTPTTEATATATAASPLPSPSTTLPPPTTTATLPPPTATPPPPTNTAVPPTASP